MKKIFNHDQKIRSEIIKIIKNNKNPFKSTVVREVKKRSDKECRYCSKFSISKFPNINKIINKMIKDGTIIFKLREPLKLKGELCKDQYVKDVK